MAELADGAADTSASSVVFHLDEADEAKQAAVLRNINHLRAALGPTTPVEPVTHGPGLTVALTDGPHQETVRALLADGVVVDACANTMRRENIDSSRLIEAVTVVPGGIVQLVIRQRQGWSYVRP